MRIHLIPHGMKAFLFTFILISLSSYQAPELKFATPESNCQAFPASWQGITPGKSVMDEVIDILGEPAVKGYSKEWQKDYFLYSPIIELPGMKEGNLIVFRKDGVVDWIDIWVSNDDGTYHMVSEYLQQYGATLDRVYVQGTNDVFGPTQVYLWSECGVAVTAVSQRQLRYPEGEGIPIVEPAQPYTGQISFRHPVHANASIQPRPDKSDVVLRKFIFPPTDYKSFREYYEDKIPYLRDYFFYKLK